MEKGREFLVSQQAALTFAVPCSHSKSLVILPPATLFTFLTPSGRHVVYSLAKLDGLAQRHLGHDDPFATLQCLHCLAYNRSNRHRRVALHRDSGRR